MTCKIILSNEAGTTSSFYAVVLLKNCIARTHRPLLSPDLIFIWAYNTISLLVIRYQAYRCICKQRKTVLNRLNLNFDYLENPMNYNSQVTLQLTLSLRNTSRILNPSAFNNAWNMYPKQCCSKSASNLYIIVIQTKTID